MMSKAGGGVAAAVVLALSCDPAAAQSTAAVALVLQVSGAPALLRAGAPLPVAVGTRVEAGDSVAVPAGASVQVLHSTGRRENIVSSMRIGSAAPSAPTGLFRRSIRTLASVATLDPRAVLNREGMVRPIPGSAVAISPRNDVTVADSQPRFTWFAVPGASGYIVQLKTGNEPPRRFRTGSDTVWVAPVPLRRGATYEWTVAALPAGRPALLQRFRVASQEEHALLRGTLDLIASEAGSDGAGSLVLTALALRDAGLLYDAAAALAALGDVTVHPDIHLVHAELLAALGDEVGAAAALRRAGRDP